MEYKIKYDNKKVGIPGWDRMCSSGCPRTKNMHTKLTGKARMKKFGGPEGYWSI